MRTSVVTGLLAGLIPLTSAFRDTSPLFLFSTSEILASPAQYATAEQVRQTLISSIKSCSSEVYIVAHQPGVTSEDYTGTAAQAQKGIARWLDGGDERIRSSFSIANVVGGMDASWILEDLETVCESVHIDASQGAYYMVDSSKPKLINVGLPALPKGMKRFQAALENDVFLSNLIDTLPSSKFTVIYTTTPNVTEAVSGETEQYHMNGYGSPLVHQELKRDSEVHARANSSKLSEPLFEKYQFFTPGIFMALFVGFILLSILYVAVSGIAGLEVSYAAFDREMGPQVQRSKQQ